MAEATRRGRSWLIGLAVFAGALVGGLTPHNPAQAVSVTDGVGLFDAEQGRWHLRDAKRTADSFFYGNPFDVPIMGDWDCDGVDTPGLFRPSDAFFYLRNTNTPGVADLRFFAGNPRDIPLAGDWDRDGCDEVGLFRPDQNRIFLFDDLATNDAGLGAADVTYVFGDPGDKPFAGDFDGNGRDEVGLHRESTGLVYYRLSHSTGIAHAQFVFGDPDDRLVAGDWTGDGTDTVGVFRPSVASFFVRHQNTQGNADAVFAFGDSDWLPVAGVFSPPPNQVPVAGDDSYTVPDGGVLRVDNLLGNDSDPDGDPLVAELIEPPSRGSLDLDPDGSFTYRHDASGPATDTFRYRASDGRASSAPARVTIEIQERNLPPVVEAGQLFEIPERSPTGTIVGFIDASDPNRGDRLALEVTGGSGAGLFSLDAGGALRTAVPDLDFDVEPATPGLRGPGPFALEVRATDPGGLSDTATVTVRLTPVNDNPPKIDPSQHFEVDENSPNGTEVGAVRATDADLPGDVLGFAIVGGSAGGALAIDLGTGLLTVVDGSLLDFERASSLTVDVKAEDDGLVPGPMETTSTLTVEVKDVNEPPTAAAVAGDAAEDGPIASGAFAGDDEDGDDDTTTLTYTIVTPPAEGTASVRAGDPTMFDFDPGGDFQDLGAGDTRDATFEYIATDRHGLDSAPATVTITVTGVNDPPVVTTTPGDTPFVGSPVIVDPGVAVADIDSATLASATVTIGGLLDPGFELLEALPAGTIAAGDISYAEPALTIAPAGGAPLADFVAVLRSVAYDHPGPATPGPRAIEFIVHDGAAASPGAVKTVLA